ncbi:MAG: hypothetical protein LBE35_10925 [Clostridiales bacterium]|jgi:hypothetical protein|nr:hypothetical protein [Clostridiales bacterium]
MDRRKHEAIQKSKIDAGNIVLKSTDPKLRSRISTNITDPGGAVYWYIRFNTVLDGESVSKHTMNVTDTKGYILNSIITYDATRNLIVLNPMDLYRQNEYYILNISKKVRSAKGNPLKRSVHILFKLVNNEITEFEMLQSTAVPKARKKPASLKRKEIQELMRVKTYSQDVDVKKNVGSPTLPFGAIGVKIHWAVIGLLLMVGSMFVQQTFVILGAMSLAALGMLHVLLQLRKKPIKSSLAYTVGVVRFNGGKYKKAQKSFRRATSLNPGNELAEYALNKVEYYL